MGRGTRQAWPRWMALAAARTGWAAPPMPDDSAAPRSTRLEEFEALLASEFASLAEEDILTQFDDRLESITNQGSGVYYEFDTQYSEVVRTGQVVGSVAQWVNANSPIPLASASKLFTGMAAMRTMELKPDLFYPEKYVHEFEGWENFGNFQVADHDRRANLNIHQLLTHTSGLPFCLRCSKHDIEKMTLFYWPGTYFGYTLGHRVIGWLLRDFWKSQPEGKAAGIETVQDTYKWLVFSKLGLSPNTEFIETYDAIFGFSGDAGDASIQSTGEDLIRLAVVALRRGALPDGTRLVSEHNWDRWAVPNLLPDGKLTSQLVEWQGTSASWHNMNVGDIKGKIMRQSGDFGWNYFGATYFDSREIGWCGFFSSCLRVTYPQNLAFVMMQRDVADLKKSKPFLVENFDAMSISLQCASETCAGKDDATTFCQQAVAGHADKWFFEPWSTSCPSATKLKGVKDVVQQIVEVPEYRHVCYKPHCRGGPCTRNTGGTCYLWGCASSRGKASCEGGKCVCAPGFCSVGGVCTQTAACRQDTGGTCNMLGCDQSRGPTICLEGRCLCKPGFCEADGQCVSESPVIDETCIGPVGTCKILGCDTSRGPTICVGGNCMCKKGFCPLNGKCVPRSSLEGQSQSDLLDWDGDLVGYSSWPLAVMVVAAAMAGLLAAGLVCLKPRRRSAGDMAERLLGSD